MREGHRDHAEWGRVVVLRRWLDSRNVPECVFVKRSAIRCSGHERQSLGECQMIRPVDLQD